MPEPVSEKKVEKPSSLCEGEVSKRRPSGCALREQECPSASERAQARARRRRSTSTYAQAVLNGVELPASITDLDTCVGG